MFEKHNSHPKNCITVCANKICTKLTIFISISSYIFLAQNFRQYLEFFTFIQIWKYFSHILRWLQFCLETHTHYFNYFFNLLTIKFIDLLFICLKLIYFICEIKFYHICLIEPLVLLASNLTGIKSVLRSWFFNRIYKSIKNT